MGYTRGVWRLARTLVFVSAVGCASAPPAEPESSPPPGGGTPYPMTAPDPALAEAAADFNGSCAFARPGPTADHYAVALVARIDTPVHDSADFAGEANRIGTVARGARLAGEGPLVGGQGGKPGYGVVLRDSQGRVCRGYVSGDDVTPAPAPTNRARGRTM